MSRGSHTARLVATAGASSLARRLSIVVIAVVLWPAAQPLTAATTPNDPQIDVREDSGTYHLTARFDVAQSSTVAFAVLSDYERIPMFVPDVRLSRVLERDSNQAIVEQETVVHLLMFSRRLHLVLNIQEEPGAIRFTDQCGKSFEHYEGVWRIAPRPDGAAITYDLVAKPLFSFPHGLLKHLFERDARRMIEALQSEMAARAKR